jgi:hypothetical protein
MAVPSETGRQVAVVLYVVAMAAVIIGVDFAFFRGRGFDQMNRPLYSSEDQLSQTIDRMAMSFRSLVETRYRRPAE